MFLTGGIVLLALLRGFVVLKAAESCMQSANSPLLSQPASLAQSNDVPVPQSYAVPAISTLPVGDASSQWGGQQELEI
jgi:hypothetical protein